MIVGIGVDMVRIERLRAAIERHGERARRRIFTPAELADCDARSDPGECLAARFAAKEAALKALGTGKTLDVRWTDVQTLRDGAGCPRLRFQGEARSLADRMGVAHVFVSISHEAGVACAMVVLETEA